MDDKIRIEGTEYTLTGMSEAFHTPEKFEASAHSTGSFYHIQGSCLESVETDAGSESLAYTVSNGSEYVLHHWSPDREQGLLEDQSGLKWLYDAESDITAYFDGQNYVAAHNPDIADFWDDIINGEWMREFVPDAVDDGMHRLHPEVRRRVERGL
ncbi:hypothetical protein ACK3SF_02935 [Candidatus Nanosalina sp. VS9-1]|uniref:hypothetical protein n=1 Tax=Candidatus Nanosalina sp. VS9-1 TaxID=3388566 RepID=UPI0039E1E258